MNCPNCNAKIESNFIYCCQCGAKIDTINKTENNESPNSTAENKKDAASANKGNKRITSEDLIQVIDNKHNKVIAKGQACYQKIIGPSPDSVKSKKFVNLTKDKRLISIDNKHFFKLDDSNYRVEKLEPFVATDFIEQNYTTGKWSEYKNLNRDEINVFMENTVQELDKEVENIVHTLNRFSPYMSTIGSCSGHGEMVAWVSLGFSNSQALIDFLNAFEPYKSKLSLFADNRSFPHRFLFYEMPFFPRDVTLRLETKDIGQSAWEILDDFDKYLKKIIKLRNRSNNTLDELITRKKIQIEGE